MNQPTNYCMSELPELSLNVLKYILTTERTTVKELCEVFGTEERETRYALDCLTDEELVKRIPNLLDMKSVYFEHEVTKEAKIIEWLGIDNIYEIFSHKHIFDRLKSNSRIND